MGIPVIIAPSPRVYTPAPAIPKRALLSAIVIPATTICRAGDRLLAAAVDRLVGAGCRAEPPVPKVVRALGSRALEPPELVVPSLRRHASLERLVSHAVARSVTEILRHDPGVRLGDDPEAVHQLR